MPLTFDLFQNGNTPLHMAVQRDPSRNSQTFTVTQSRILSTESGTAREKGRDLTKSYDSSPYTHRKYQKAKCYPKTPPKL